MSIYGGVPTAAGNYLAIGGSVTVGSTFDDRDAYFLRWDETFWSTHSVALKWVHEDLKFITSSIDAFGVDYNGFWPWSERSGVYFVLGGYYRYLKQNWNGTWWAPLSLNSSDQEGYLEAELGWQFSWGATNFVTFDLGSRDPFSYSNIDNTSAVERECNRFHKLDIS